MEIGEAAAVVVISENHDEDCYFCKAKDEEPSTEVNELTDEHDEDAAELENSLGEYKFKNSAGKLGTALGGKPEVKTVTICLLT